MNMSGIKTAARAVVSGIKQKSPTILTSLGAAGVFGTAVLAVRATPEAIRNLQDHSVLDSSLYLFEDKGIKDVLKLSWKYYIPTMIMATTTVGCIIGANSINLRRNAALASIYSLTEATLREYQAKVVETIGEKKERAIKDSIAQDKLDKNPLSGNQIIFTGKGETLCFDPLSGRYFKNDLENLRKIQNDINHDLISNMWISLNDVYDLIGLARTKVGDDLGWNVDKMLNFIFTAKIAEGGHPCIVIDYTVEPTISFRN
jgi:hypothetical protein